MGLEEHAGNGEVITGFSVEGEEGNTEEEGHGEFVDETAPVGSRYFSQYCLNGEVFTEPCDDFRFGYCNEGKCSLNPWQECLAVNENEEEGDESEEGEEGPSLEECNEEFCRVWSLGLEEGTHEVEGFIGGKRMGRVSKPGERVVSEFSNAGILADLELDMCVPLVAGGLVHYPSAESFEVDKSAEEICALGNFEIEIEFQGCNPWKCVNGCGLVEGSGEWSETASCGGGGGRPEGNIWEIDEETAAAVEAAWHSNGGEGGEILINEEVVGLLNERCRAIADCSGKLNFLGAFGGEEQVVEVAGFSSRHDNDPDTGRDSVYYNFAFECKPWSAPDEGECEACGVEDLPCSEYQCRSIGKHCQYFR